MSKRQDKPDGIAWLIRNHPELSDGQIGKLIGTTRTTIAAIRERTHWNIADITPKDPVALGLCSQRELDATVAKAAKMKGIQAKYGRNSVGVITSSRCTNEETYLVQKLTRAVFMNNNTDTCARVCHSPTGYGLKTTFGTSAGTQDFASVEHPDVVILIGAIVLFYAIIPLLQSLGHLHIGLH